MLRIGLTGGIGSGKSTASRVFETLGIPVYDSDSRAKSLMNTDGGLIAGIKEEFGDGSYKNGELDTARIAALAFNDKSVLMRLNALVHPAVLRNFDSWARGQRTPYVIMESAIIFEAGIAPLLDYVITVSAPLEERLARAMQRDGTEPDKIRRRMANQMSDQERGSRADFILDNTDNILLVPQIIKLHDELLSIEKEAEDGK